MIINDLDGYYIVFDTKNWNTELDTLVKYCFVRLSAVAGNLAVICQQSCLQLAAILQAFANY